MGFVHSAQGQVGEKYRSWRQRALTRVLDSDFKFIHQLLHERAFRSRRTTDDEVLTYFTQIEEKIHVSSRKVLKLPPKPSPAKANAVNTGEAQAKGKSKRGKPRSESAPPKSSQPATKPEEKKGGKKGSGHGKGGKPAPKPTPSPSGTPAPNPKPQPATTPTTGEIESHRLSNLAG